MKTSALAGVIAALILAAGPMAGCSSSEEKPGVVASSEPRTVIVDVDGMVCNFCATNIDQTLAKLPGVSAVYVNLAAGKVVLQATEKQPVDEAIRKAVKDSGFEPKAISRETEDFAAVKARIKADAVKKLDQ